ncbi:putative selenate ABC transporter substrate-binding protein [Shewanella surugensis]|uniref:Selenate ABC transporter substrate-binding protein n=1 Tax=Shewanella surugensis TaxID=212020 RepID=A0ABT0L7E5_9GAMM|nr:putative selenate ABC transporter substrate-binding protein [Shewanella surugensis]MCL1123618.1 putative selenate ABC transporter substrate-binding protein [Shewanella surugensis]
MIFFKKFSILLLLLVTPKVFSATLFFTAIPNDEKSILDHHFNAVANDLAAKLHIDVQYIAVGSYAEAVNIFKENQVQLAWFGGLSGVQARRAVPGSEAIAQGYEDQFFRSYFIANASADIIPSKSFPNLNGYTFTFGSPDSTSGRLMPQFFIERNLGKAPHDVFRRVGFSENHLETIEQVQSGVYQVGAVDYKIWERAVTEGLVDFQKISVIWESPSFPDTQWTVRAGIDEQFGKGFKQKLQQVLLGMRSDDAQSRLLFVPVEDHDYEAIEDVAQAIGLID